MRQNFKNYFEAQLFNTVHHATLRVSSASSEGRMGNK